MDNDNERKPINNNDDLFDNEKDKRPSIMQEPEEKWEEPYETILLGEFGEFDEYK